MDDKPLVSIVTPVFNGEPYLRECIESVLAQTYPNWEYLIVDNKSSDKTVAIANEYARQDSRVKVIQYNEHLPVMPNWNRALQLISPESVFCKVIHADDILFPDCVSAMVSVGLQESNIGLVGAYRINENHVDLDWLPFPQTVFSGNEICRRSLLGSPDIFGSPTNIMMRSDIVRDRGSFYDESDIHADTAVCFDVLNKWNFGYVHQVLTYTRRHNESETSRVKVLNTHSAAYYSRFARYGPVYLSSEEYATRYRLVNKRYYRMLAYRYLKATLEIKHLNGANEFISYHRSALKEIGEDFRYYKLAISMLKLAYNKVLSVLTIV